MSRSIAFAAALVLAAAACFGPTEACACSPLEVPMVQVSGVVRAPDGAPLAGIAVVGRVVQVGGAGRPSSQGAPSDAQGRYVVTVVGAAAGEATVELAAARPGRTDSVRVQVRAGMQYGTPATVPADLVLP